MVYQHTVPFVDADHLDEASIAAKPKGYHYHTILFRCPTMLLPHVVLPSIQDLFLGQPMLERVQINQHFHRAITYSFLLNEIVKRKWRSIKEGRARRATRASSRRFSDEGFHGRPLFRFRKLERILQAWYGRTRNTVAIYGPPSRIAASGRRLHWLFSTNHMVAQKKNIRTYKTDVLI
ncbi:hypothetical protein [Gordonibacter urolithinfaciens]|uniref:Uncharacterized protein n=1 Tax=Gordonibacter urolithinfaciens TaxID=1335613 RepID=A0A6N8IKN5_9ACTN|nr:hypothetical protein [Gordonibacter urolithinfaciens]